MSDLGEQLVEVLAEGQADLRRELRAIHTEIRTSSRLTLAAVVALALASMGANFALRAFGVEAAVVSALRGEPVAGDAAHVAAERP